MRKDSTTAKLIETEIERNKSISNVRYIIEQYFGISHLHDSAKRAEFTDITKNKFDGWYRKAVYNIARGQKKLRVATVSGGEVRLVVENRTEHLKLGGLPD